MKILQDRFKIENLIIKKHLYRRQYAIKIEQNF